MAEEFSFIDPDFSLTNSEFVGRAIAAFYKSIAFRKQISLYRFTHCCCPHPHILYPNQQHPSKDKSSKIK